MTLLYVNPVSFFPTSAFGGPARSSCSIGQKPSRDGPKSGRCMIVKSGPIRSDPTRPSVCVEPQDLTIRKHLEIPCYLEPWCIYTAELFRNTWWCWSLIFRWFFCGSILFAAPVRMTRATRLSILEPVFYRFKGWLSTAARKRNTERTDIFSLLLVRTRSSTFCCFTTITTTIISTTTATPTAAAAVLLLLLLPLLLLQLLLILL